jgi:monolysocardiolipin acyltransferase
MPIVRGEGIDQPVMDFMLARINHGEWIHIFPEGKVNQDKEYMRLKWGVGRLVMEARDVPLVVPIYHEGLEHVMPLNRKYPIPLPGKDVLIAFGEPIDGLEQLVHGWKQSQKDTVKTRVEITHRIHEAMHRLRQDVQSR